MMSSLQDDGEHAGEIQLTATAKGVKSGSIRFQVR